MAETSFEDLTAQLFSSVRNKQLSLFFTRLSDNPAQKKKFCSVCHSNDLLQDYLLDTGAPFSAYDLNQFVSDSINQSLSLRELRQRNSWISRNHGPCKIKCVNSKFPITSRQLYCTNYSLDRQSIFNGNVILLRNLPALSLFVDYMRNMLMLHFRCDNLSTLHTKFDQKEFLHISKDAYESWHSDSLVPNYINSIVSQLGIDPDDILWEWPSFRIFFPRSSYLCGSYKGDKTSSLAPHRDTWFGAPQHQINFWGPIQPLGTNSSLRIYPKYHIVPIINTSHIWDVWAPSFLSVPPRLLESVDSSIYIAPDMELNETLIFSSHCLHSSPPQETSVTRVTFEFRIIHKMDQDLPSLPSNIDYFGLGHLFANYFNSNGVETNYYDYQPL